MGPGVCQHPNDYWLLFLGPCRLRLRLLRHRLRRRRQGLRRAVHPNEDGGDAELVDARRGVRRQTRAEKVRNERGKIYRRLEFRRSCCSACF